MGSVRPDAVDVLVKLAELELAKLQEARKPSLFPAESYVEDVVAARNQPQDIGPLVIEEGFRVLKHTMAIRPIFHWVERRVRAHIAICFVAFALLRILRHQYNARFGTKQRLSEGQILAELGNVEASVICDRGNQAEYLLPSKATREGIRLYQVVNQTLQRQTVLFKKGTTP